jgi:hypothetical protein
VARGLYYSTGSSTQTIALASFGFGNASASYVYTNMGLMYDALVTFLTTAGWTQNHIGTRNDVFTSNGEAGTESINFQMTYASPGIAGPSTESIALIPGTKVNASGVLQGNISTTAQYMTGVTGTACKVAPVVLVTKDFLLVNVWATPNVGVFTYYITTGFIGNLERDYVTNQNVLTSSGTATAGTFVNIPVQQNPYANNYLPGDLVQIVSTATSDAAQAQTVRIVNIDNSSITIDSLAATYSTGARIGANPSPIVVCAGGLIDFVSTSWFSPLATSLTTTTTSDILGSGSTGLALTPDLAAGIVANSSPNLQDGFGKTTIPNKRTRRFTARSMELRSPNDAVLGRVPGLYVYPGNLATGLPGNLEPALFNRVTPNENFIISSTNDSTTYMIGKSN